MYLNNSGTTNSEAYATEQVEKADEDIALLNTANASQQGGISSQAADQINSYPKWSPESAEQMAENAVVRADKATAQESTGLDTNSPEAAERLAENAVVNSDRATAQESTGLDTNSPEEAEKLAQDAVSQSDLTATEQESGMVLSTPQEAEQYATKAVADTESSIAQQIYGQESGTLYI